MAKALPYEIPSVAVDPVFGLGLPFALRLALTVQYLVANDLVDLPLLGFDLVVDLFVDQPLAVPVLLLVHLHLLVVLVVLVVGLVLVPLRLLVQVQAAESPALLPLHANWEVPVLQADLLRIVLVDELPGERH